MQVSSFNQKKRTHLRGFLDQQGIQIQTVRQQPRPDGAPPDAQGGVANGVLPPGGHLGLLQVRVHRRVDTHDRPRDDGAILELDRDLFSVELLEEFDQLHDIVVVG